MENLFATSRELISRVDTSYVRDKHQEIDWNSRLIAILGSRGTGKTTMILQHIRLYDNTPHTLYVTADDFFYKDLDDKFTKDAVDIIEKKSDYFIQQDEVIEGAHIMALYTCDYSIKNGRLIVFYIEEVN